ncbi:MAG: hypothetical protein IH951_11815 [Bacteroidetes bacterium]|nr:hypothetical protein [Bacteroidota bacterium]
MSSNPAEEVQSVTPTGQPVKKRFRDARAAKKVFDRLHHNDTIAAYYRAQIQGLIDGNPPYSQARLRELGQGWRANVNWREAESTIEFAAGAYWELLMEVPSFIDIKIIDYPGKKLRKQHQERPNEDWAQIIAEEFTTTLKSWDDFYFNMQQKTSEFLKFGRSGCFFRDPWDWRFESLKTASILFPDDTKATIGKIKLAFIRDVFPADEFLEKIDSEVAQEAGWNIKASRDALIKTYHEGISRDKISARDAQFNPWEHVQEQIRSGNFWEEHETDIGIRVVHVLAVEMSGKVSHMIIPEDYDPDEGYLFEAHERFDEMSQVLAPFLFGIGDGRIRSVKGLGHRIFPHMEYSNRFLCSMFDGAMISSGLVLQNNGGSDVDAFRIQRIGPFTMLPRDVSPVQSSFAPSIERLIAARQVQQRTLNNNIGRATPRSEDPSAEKTAAQVGSEDRQEANFQKNQVTNYYVQLDRLYRETFRRLANKDYEQAAGGYDAHKKFIKRCVARGVPRSIIDPQYLEIQSSRAIGLGSPNMRMQILDKMMSKIGLYDEAGKRNLTRDWTAGLAGYNNVDRYVPVFNRDQIPTDESSIADLENNDFPEGKFVSVGFDQNHVIHIRRHIAPIRGMMQAMQEKPETVDPVQASRFLGISLDHIDRHLAFLRENPSQKSQIDGFTDFMKQARRVQRTIDAQAQKVLDQQQQQAQQDQDTLRQAADQTDDTDLQLKLMQLRGKQQLDSLKAQHALALKAQKQEFNLALADQESAADIARKDRVVAANQGVQS